MSGFLATRTRSGFMKEGPGFVDPYRDIGRHFSPSLRPLCIINSVEVTKNGSDRVAQMTDQSGLGNHFVQATDADKPLWVANQLNGFPIIRFTKGDTEFLENMSPFLVTPAPATQVASRTSPTRATYGRRASARVLVRAWGQPRAPRLLAGV
jgi:hypothetical protein